MRNVLALFCVLALSAGATADPIDRILEADKTNRANLSTQPNQSARAITRPFTLTSPLPAPTREALAEPSGYLIPGFHLSRSRDGADASDGALFSLVHDSRAADGDPADTYSADFYLVWNPQETFGSKNISEEPVIFSLSVEGHASSASDKAADAWIVRGSFAPKPLTITENATLDTDLSIKYESDRDFEQENIGLEATVTPTIPKLAIGESLSGWHGFRWRPVAAIESGYVLDTKDESSVEENGLCRISGSLAVQWRLLSRRHAGPNTEGLAGGSGLPFDSLDFFAQDKLRYLLAGDGRETNNLLSCGLSAVILENTKMKYSVSASYTVGRDAPTFEKVEKIDVGLSVKF